MAPDATELGRQIIDAALALGFAAAGIVPAAPTERREEFLAWLARGGHGEMRYMAEHVEERLDITKLLPGARSVIMVADQYAPRGTELPLDASAVGSSGQVAKYARGQDYHSVIRRRLHALADRLKHLHPEASFRTFVDTGPVLEREHAARAGLGFIGKHTLLINPRLGSYLLLGGIATTLDLAAPLPALSPQSSARPHCGTCTRCIDACPTRAITPFKVEATRCISYLTLEHRSPIAPEFHRAMGDRLLGCDICQDVCPFNHAHPDEHARINPAYHDTASRARLPILEILNWTEEDRTRVLSGSAAKRASLDMLKRNAAIVAANDQSSTSSP